MPEKKKEQKKQGLACLFPGIGYTADRPLLRHISIQKIPASPKRSGEMRKR